MFDLHDVCDLLRERIRELEAATEAEGDDPATTTAQALRQWRRALEVVRDAARKVAG